MKYTLKDIALRANTSVMTVSRVINDSKEVNEKTRKIILDIIEELDYKPNIFARNLKYQTSNFIGMVIIDFFSPSFPPIIKGVEQIAKKNNLSTIVIESELNKNLEKKSIDILLSQMVTGIIIAPTSVDFSYINKVINSGANIVVLGEVKGYDNIPFVCNNEFLGMHKAIEYLIDNGHKKILFINIKLDILSKYTKLESYKSTLLRHNLEFDPNLIYYTIPTIEGGYNISKKIFKTPKNFSAIICYNDQIAIGVMNYCAEKNIKIPENLSVMGYDDTYIAPYLKPPLTSVHNYKKTLGIEAAKLLINRINNIKTKKTKIVFDTDIVVRNTVRKIN